MTNPDQYIHSTLGKPQVWDAERKEWRDPLPAEKPETERISDSLRASIRQEPR